MVDQTDVTVFGEIDAAVVEVASICFDDSLSKALAACVDDDHHTPISPVELGTGDRPVATNSVLKRKRKRKQAPAACYEHWSHCYVSDVAFPSYIVQSVGKALNDQDHSPSCVLQSNSAFSGVGVISLKYWRQRHLLFSKFSKGIQLDSESFYSVTPEAIAQHIAERCTSGVVIDAFAGAGGNAIAFAQTCSMINPDRIAMARHNAKIYGVEDRIEFIVGDFLTLAPSLKADVVFLSPPWGGPNYLEAETFDIASNIVPNGIRIFEAASRITPNVTYFLPRNVDVIQAISLAGCGRCCEIETNYLGAAPKTVTAYYGDLIAIDPTVPS